MPLGVLSCPGAQTSESHAVQFVLAGMNAHINHDLALAVVEICTLDHTYPLAGNIPSDFRKMNEVLGAIESEVRHSLLQELEVEPGQERDPLVHVIDSWSIRQARVMLESAVGKANSPDGHDSGRGLSRAMAVNSLPRRMAKRPRSSVMCRAPTSRCVPISRAVN